MKTIATVFACALLLSCGACNNNDGGGDGGFTLMPSTSFVCASGTGTYTGSFRVADRVIRWTGILPQERQVTGSGMGVASFRVPDGNEVCAWEDRNGCDFFNAVPQRADCGQTARVEVFL